MDHFVFKDSSSPVKASSFNPLSPTYLRWIADQTRSKYDQPTLYRRPPRYTPAQHTTSGERDHPRPFFNQLKKLIPLTTTSQSGPDQSPLYFRPTYALPDQGRSVNFSRAGESGGWAGLWCERAFSRSGSSGSKLLALFIYLFIYLFFIQS